ncbi:amino acid permease-associated protein [Fictibacillus macauensis ZFHKF-1]|uniref:Amino acid permease-associated protein n=1 Tax=Fictibacillus macauensis ZFHKF-1 TaxID=1196324 RepID=I8IY34_9BACL|nr:amino acid permease [Fictibacillus macauensis]EIT84396.1 amino acid permease-associated protein [Fictibacillus macauensis ZFHKF-1]
MKQQEELQRGLESRHITLMSLGAAIGVGLFLGSGKAIDLAGPSILIGYAVAGAVMFLIMRSLGEMAINNPVAGSFSRYAKDYLGPLAGYITGWNYWFLWIVTCMAEITAVGIYMDKWFPYKASEAISMSNVPTWIWSLAALIIMALVNLIAAKAYGEFEFWFALIKIVAIIALIIIGLGIIIFGFGNGGVATGISNLWNNGGFAPHGVKGILMSLQIVMFAFLGIEMIGVTAGEVKNPKKVLARAIDTVFWRILIFYIGALFVIMSIYPWDQIGTAGSPFVLTFEKIGLGQAAGIINFVVLTAALSSCNSGIFSTGRMLFNLAQQKQAPASLKKINRGGVPSVAILVSAFVLLIGVALNYLFPGSEVFTWITSISTFGAIWTWATIILSQMRFRKTLTKEQLKELKYKAPLYPFGSYLALAFLVLVIGVMAFFEDTRIALYVGPIWILLLVLFYYMNGHHKTNKKSSL